MGKTLIQVLGHKKAVYGKRIINSQHGTSLAINEAEVKYQLLRKQKVHWRQAKMRIPNEES